MLASVHKDTIKNLIPALSLKQRQEILAYFSVYEKYSLEFSKMAMEGLRNHPIFGRLIKSISKELAEENSKLSLALQKDAILNDNWQPYIEHQMVQGISYAKMELSFKSWYEVTSMIRNYLNRYLHKEYGDSEKFFSALSGMNTFMDIAMGVIGEAYMHTKQMIIEDDQDQIMKLNEELEQKVIDRTVQLANNIQLLEEYKYFFINSHDLACIANMNGYFINVNPQFENVLGYSKREMLENPFLDFVHPEDVVSSLREMEKLKEGALTMNFVNRYRKKDGTYLWLEWTISPDVKAGKQYGIARDVTERKHIEDQLLLVNKELEAFSYSVSHDLRAPLRAVNGYAQILHDDYSPQFDAEGQRIVEAVIYNSEKMGMLIDDLLAFSRLGRKEVLKTNIEMNQMTQGILSELNKTIKNNAEIKIEKLHSVTADYSLLHQVMYNLISNAIKYSSKIEKPVVVIFSEEIDNEIIFGIKDNGVGFDMQFAHKLFGVFQRLHKARDFEGTGVGLAIVQRIINKHGGRIWVEATPDKGATFYFTLPNN